MDAPAPCRFDPLLARGYRHLGRRDRTTAELRRHLAVREADEALVQAVLDELAAQGYLDDAAYARRFVEDRRTLDGWGAERIERRLRELGVDRVHVDAALRGIGPEDECGAAVGVLRAKLRIPPRDDRDRERALRLLVRRGYELEVAYDAVRAFERDAA